MIREVEDLDVVIERRDGPDLMLVTVDRENAIREGLGTALRALQWMLSDSDLADRSREAFSDSLPWYGWLPLEDQLTFLTDFSKTASVCTSTGVYSPLEKMLNAWEKTALIHHDPALRSVLTADRGPDQVVAVTAPNDAVARPVAVAIARG